MNIPVFVISLKRSVERRQHTSQQLNDLGVPFQIVEAVDGTALSDQEIHNNNEFGIYKFGFHSRYLFKEEIGCALSHLKILRKMIEEEIALACILEDDNDYTKEFKDLLVNGNIFNAKWDILFLGHHSGFTKGEARSRNKMKVIPLNYFIGEAIEIPYGAYAYIITNKAAEKLLDRAYPVTTPFDTLLGTAAAHGSYTCLLSPVCAVNSSLFTSTIYTDQKIVYSTPFRKGTGEAIRKLYFWFPFLQVIRKLIFATRNRFLCYLRCTGIIKNNYAKN